MANGISFSFSFLEELKFKTTFRLNENTIKMNEKQHSNKPHASWSNLKIMDDHCQKIFYNRGHNNKKQHI